MLSYYLNISELIYLYSDELVMAHIIWHAIMIAVFSSNDTAISWVSSLHLWSLYHHISPLQCHFQKIARVAMKCTLHCHSILTTPLPLRSVNAVLISDALQCHSGVTLHCDSNATPKVHFNATPECTLHCHSITTTPMPFSQNTPMPLRCVFGHSKDTLLPLRQGKGHHKQISVKFDSNAFF